MPTSDSSTLRYRRLRAYIRRKLRDCRRNLWAYYAFREDYGRRHNGHYGPLAHLRELPLQIRELEDILAYR
jgi:hypothetical protein